MEPAKILIGQFEVIGHPVTMQVMKYVAMLLMMILLVACDQQAAPQAPAKTAAKELSLSEQIAAVERGNSTEIHCLHAPLPPSQVPDILKLTNLVRLALSDTALTDEDVKQIAALPKLETLRFASPHVTDEAMAHLATSKTLRHLILLSTPITDRGLESLAGLQTLESLYLTDTKVTDEGLSKLIKAKPQLHVH